MRDGYTRHADNKIPAAFPYSHVICGGISASVVRQMKKHPELELQFSLKQPADIQCELERLLLL